MGGTVSQVIAHQRPGYRPERLLHGRDLGQNIGAVSIFIDHPVQSANLAFDAAQAT